MQHLYGVSIRGKMLYFAGSISDDKFGEVEEIANQTSSRLKIFCSPLVNHSITS